MAGAVPQGGLAKIGQTGGHVPAGPTLADTPALDLYQKGLSHNLAGQKLGRKGRDTRDRILAATAELLDGLEDEPISLSTVARRASLGMTSLYNYFSDLTELLLAVLEGVVATSEQGFVAVLADYWPDDVLCERSCAFIEDYHRYWASHTRLLHLRNSMADGGDRRMMMQRIRASQPVIARMAVQMNGDPTLPKSPAMAAATVLITGVERLVTVNTDSDLVALLGDQSRFEASRYLKPGARMIELMVRDQRQQATHRGR